MDNVTHTLCGFALARLLFPRAGGWVTGLVAFAANAPDLDLPVNCKRAPSFRAGVNCSHAEDISWLCRQL